MHWVIVGLTITISLANLGDFIFGDKGNRRLLSKLTDFYVAVDGDWNSTYQVPALKMSEFLKHAFGRSWIVYLFRVAMYSVCAVCMIALFLNLTFRPTKSESIYSRVTQLSFYLPFFVTGNCLADLISWSIARIGLATIARSGFGFAVMILIACTSVSLGVAYFSFVIAWLPILLFFAANDLLPYVNDELFFIVPLLTTLPIIVFVLTTGCGILLVALRPLLRAPLMGALERVDRAPRSVLTLSAVALSGVVGLLAALAK
jgi:hypothetical protein